MQGTHSSPKKQWVVPTNIVMCCYAQDQATIFVKLAPTTPPKAPFSECSCNTKHKGWACYPAQKGV